LLNASVSGRIYRDAAPNGTAYPLVLFRFTAGGEENATLPRSVDTRYEVFCESEVSADEAGDVAEKIDQLLHGTAMVMNGFAHVWTSRETLLSVSQFDEVSGKRYWLRGAVYRIRAEQIS
jgi:hypothetical protein